MAHDIDMTKAGGSAMFAYSPAWHGLGTVVTEAQTSADALRIAGLDWDVATTALVADFGEQAGDRRYRRVPDRRATFRSDTGAPLGAVGTRYTPLQNRDAFAWMDAVVGESLAIWHTCGSLGGGRRVWMLAKLPGSLEVADRDVLEKYALIMNPHDGSGAVWLFPTSTRVVCANTLRLAMSEGRRSVEAGGGLRLRHTEGSLARRVEKAKEVFGLIDKAHESLADTARTMLNKPMSSRQISEYFGTLVSDRTDRARGKVLTSLWDRFALPTNSESFGANVWTAYNAASEYADHELRVLGTAEQKAERRFSSALFGSSDAFKQKAWREAMSLATVA
jgi:phage/plasmid-like protein (TIGR03299 family)